MSLKGNEAVLVAAAVAGSSLAEIAEASGLSVSSVQRRLRDEKIIAQVREARSRQREETVGRLSELRSNALTRLAELISSQNESVALRAVNLTLSSSERFDLVHDLDELLATYEKAGVDGNGARDGSSV